MDDVLFSPLDLRGRRLPNRIALSPMCQYSAKDGMPQDWHLRHYAERAIGGAGLVMLESTAVLPEGRITPYDLGIWSDAHASALARLVAVIHAAGALAGVQLGHAGRKASTDAPWLGGKPLQSGGWQTRAPSNLAFGSYPKPLALRAEEHALVVRAFAEAAKRAASAGFDVIELHAAHGYLLHQYLSPLSNQRTDEWGGDRPGRFRLPLEVTAAARAALPDELPLFVRLSATDWVEGGWSVEESIELCREFKSRGVDLVDVSTGGLVSGANIPVGPCYQVGFSESVRKGAKMPVGAVGLITKAEEARSVLAEGKADLVFMGRQLLRDPYWPIRNAPADSRKPPVQYALAFK
jgi:2,4-dienoyl-CoA reductase-like NADH-dependent reductase (Old Yellow Enzyme family)